MAASYFDVLNGFIFRECLLVFLIFLQNMPH